MASSTVFISNRSQAVRLPKAVAFPVDVHQVNILKIGRSRVVMPQGTRWEDLFAHGPRASEEFLVEREQQGAAWETSIRTNCAPSSTPHPTSLRSATFSHKGRR